MLPPSPRYTGYRSFDYLEPGRDYQEFKLAPELGHVPARRRELSEAQRRRADRLLADSVVISLHDHPTVFPDDITSSFELIRTGRHRTGYEGLARSGLTAVFDNFMDGTGCITSQAGWKWDDVVYDLGHRFCDLAHQDFVFRAESLADVRRAHETGTLALVPGLEAATMIENEVDRIDILYGLGVRQMGIAYSEANALGSGLRERRDGGLTAFGERAVERMNRLGMAIDVSHSGDQTCLDVIAASRAPVLITHAGARAVWDSPRMKPDSVIRACAERGGLIGIEAAPHTTLSAGHPHHSIDSVMDHLRYCVELVGIEHVTFGPDTLFGDHVGIHEAFAEQLSIGQARGGLGFPRVPWVEGLENPAECFGNIIDWLVAHDWSDDETRALVGGNTVRVLEDIWA
ncbi:MAG TPA: membrane dipeptidase [Actinomycetes bacterium]